QVEAGLGSGWLYKVGGFGQGGEGVGAVGQGAILQPERAYHLECRGKGSVVKLPVGGVDVLTQTLPAGLPSREVGVFIRSKFDVVLKNFRVQTQKPTAFVVMQFSSPFNELYTEVVKPVCKELSIDAFRADDTYGPGLIIADVVKQIDEAKVIIAEISPI